MKKVVIAMDSFKGTMDAPEVCQIVADAVRALLPGAEIRTLPMADGGEGMVSACLSILGGERVPAIVSGPRGEMMEVLYGMLPDGTPVMEMASCAGLPLMGENKDPLHATTRGVGQLILHAVQNGAARVLMGIGGSATNDGGIGMASAFGYRFLDGEGTELEPLAVNLSRIRRIESPKALPNVSVTVACDVDNPLYGPAGAAYTFGRQKGADDEMLKILDAGLKNLADVIEKDMGLDVRTMPGAGAAGGLGAGLVAFLGAKLLPGIDLILDAAGFDKMIEGADLVYTGEGRIDWQSAHGKVPVGIASRAERQGIPCVALCGAIGENMEKVYDYGITAAFAAVRGATDFAGIQQTCREDLRLLATAVTRLLCRTGL